MVFLTSFYIQEYDVAGDSMKSPIERLARQKQNLRRRLGKYSHIFIFILIFFELAKVYGKLLTKDMCTHRISRSFVFWHLVLIKKYIFILL